jgi:hypothetical protein
MASKLKTQAEMEVIRAADGILRAKQIKEFVPEKNTLAPMAYFQIDRYVSGNFRGMFVVSQLIDEEGRRPLKRPIRKVICDGVDMVVAMSSLETALRRRVFR